MSDTNQVPAASAKPSDGEVAAAQVEASVEAGATQALDLPAIERTLIWLKEVAPEDYAALLKKLPSAEPDAYQTLIKHLQIEDPDTLRKYIVQERDKDSKAFREMVGSLQTKNVEAFLMLVSQLQAMAQEALQELFAKLNVTKIVCVDDEYSRFDVEYVIGLIEAATLDLVKEIGYFDDIPLEAGRDLYVPELRARWNDTDENRKAALCESLRRLVGIRAEREDASGAGRDARDAGFLSLLLQGQEFLPLSLTQWKQQREMLINEAATRNTLFLFDQDLHHDGGGLREGISLLQSVLVATQENVLCGLLSHTISLDNEYSEWKKYCAGEGVDSPMNPHRFILISKSHLYPDPMSFVRMAKLTALNARCRKLVLKAGIAFENAHKEAVAEIGETDIYDFEHLVFRSSQREGVWEPDTLFRLLGIYHRVKAREGARAGDELEKLAEEIRSVSDIVTGPRYFPSRRIWQIRHYELYEDSEFINKYHMPLELGDVFKTAAGKMFILLRQPCDLMLRRDKNGERHQAVVEAEVAEVVSPIDANGTPRLGFSQGKPNEQDDYFELPCFDPATGSNRYVWFRSRRTVALSVLDLCVFDRDGKACLVLNAPPPPGLTALWSIHYEGTQRETVKCFNRYSEIKKRAGTSNDDAIKVFPQSSNLKSVFKVNFDAAAQTLSYDCQRILRLCQPRAGTMLTHYANYLSRDAFEHDFTEELPA